MPKTSRADRGRAASPPGPAVQGSVPGALVGAPVTTNSWARRTVLSRAQELGLSPDLARQVGSVALWYYNRIVQLQQRNKTADAELPPNINRYLVPIALYMACEHKGRIVELERILRLSGTPTKRTVDTAQILLADYRRRLAPPRRAARPVKEGRTSSARPAAPASKAAAPPAQFQVRAPSIGASSASAPTKTGAARPTGPGTLLAPVTALAVPPSEEIVRLRDIFRRANPVPDRTTRSPPRSRQQSTNAWARKRIADLSRTLGLPEPVRKRSLQMYERIVDFHSVRSRAPPGKRLQLSPRLNSSLVYTTLYLGCRLEEYPKDLRDILGGTPQQGSLREIFGLYRFYKRELKLTINLVDVRTFILSWLDGFELSDLVHEAATLREQAWIQRRAMEIADKAKGMASMRKTSTKLIAAGAFTTALAERDPPGNLHAFYKAVADLLHMSEWTIRSMAARIAAIL
jgi:transcription initiation factor TFIIIB Brf1 subunit/transcription initiation factor TFIIB